MRDIEQPPRLFLWGEGGDGSKSPPPLAKVGWASPPKNAYIEKTSNRWALLPYIGEIIQEI
jgi:hypothetical protein